MKPAVFRYVGSLTDGQHDLMLIDWLSDKTGDIFYNFNDRGGWKVLCDRNGYPLSALLLSDYEDFCNYFGDCKYLDEKVAWFSKPLPKGIPSV